MTDYRAFESGDQRSVKCTRRSQRLDEEMLGLRAERVVPERLRVGPSEGVDVAWALGADEHR